MSLHGDNVCGQYNGGLLPDIMSLQPMFPVGLNIQICVHDSSIIFVYACVHRDWRFEAFVDVNILGAGDDLLLSSAAGKPRYIQLKRLR